MSSILYLFTELEVFPVLQRQKWYIQKAQIYPHVISLEISKPFWREKKKKLKQHGVLKSAQHSFPNKGVRKPNEVAKESVNGVREDRQAD